MHRAGWEKLNISRAWQAFQFYWPQTEKCGYFDAEKPVPVDEFLTNGAEQATRAIDGADGDEDRMQALMFYLGRRGRPFRCSAVFASKVVGCSQATAYRILHSMVERGDLVLVERGGGRARMSNQYALPDWS